jgi:hypothetical protein
LLPQFVIPRTFGFNKRSTIIRIREFNRPLKNLARLVLSFVHVRSFPFG